MASSLLAGHIGGSLALACALGCAVAACGDASPGALGEQGAALEVSTGPYHFVDCDLTPATSYRIDGSRIQLSFNPSYGLDRTGQQYVQAVSDPALVGFGGNRY